MNIGLLHFENECLPIWHLFMPLHLFVKEKICADRITIQVYFQQNNALFGSCTCMTIIVCRGYDRNIWLWIHCTLTISLL
jgi:hypothetical protein